MAANTTEAPRFDVVDPQRNWYFVSGGDVADDASGRFIAYATPYDIVYYMQMRLGIAADGNWGTGTSTRLVDFLRETNAPASYITAVEAVKNSRSLSGTNGLIAWTLAVYLSQLPRGVSPDWSAVQRGEVALGTNATVSSVRLPTYGQVAPGRLTRTATQTPPRTRPAADTAPSATLPALLGNAAGSATNATKKLSWQLIAAVLVLVIVLGGLVVYASSDATPSNAPRGMSKEEARRVLGVGPTATPSEIRDAWKRRSFAAAPGKGSAASPEFARVNLAYQVLTGSSQAKPAGIPAASATARANPSHLRR